jgi:hypothetical protein
MAWFSASTQTSASSVFNNRHAKSLRVCQSMIATRYRKAPKHLQIGDGRRPNLIGPRDAQLPQQIRIGLVALRGLVGVWLLVDRHKANQLHETSEPFLVPETVLTA